jgi:hypothetical protein
LILVVELIQFDSKDFNLIQLIQIKPISIDLNPKFNELIKSIEFEFERPKYFANEKKKKTILNTFA